MPNILTVVLISKFVNLVLVVRRALLTCKVFGNTCECRTNCRGPFLVVLIANIRIVGVTSRWLLLHEFVYEL